MHIKVAGAQALEATITLPLAGAWTALVDADTDTAITGLVSLTVADLMEFRGTAVRSGINLGHAQLRIVSGAGRLDETVLGFAYYMAPLRTILGDLLGAVGETLSSTSDAAMLARVPRHWVRCERPARAELEVLADHFGFAWRHLPDGTMWIGSESWPTSSLTNYVILQEDEADNSIEIAAEIPSVLPGHTFRDRHVQSVTHTLAAKKLRTRVGYL